MTSLLQSAFRVWQAEGTAAVRDRVWDRVRDARARAFASRLDGDRWPGVAVLNVIGVPVAVRFGGVPLQLATRLRHEARHRPVALLSRDTRRGWRLDLWRDSGRRLATTTFAGGDWNGDVLASDDAWLDAIRRCSELLQARAVHIENAAGLSLVSLAHLAHLAHVPRLASGAGGDATPPALVLSAHDFSLFCRHPHLWDARGRFCNYSTDAATCDACLRAAAAANGAGDHRVDQLEHRRLGAQLLRDAAHIVFPSAFLRDRLFALLDARHGDGAVARGAVIPPGIDIERNTPQSARHADQIAFLGGGQDHKGGHRFPRLAAALAHRGLNVTIYGGYGLDNLLALRQVRRSRGEIRVRGYFRSGSLPTLLARQNASVAVALSAVPESFSLALSEAWAAGVPVVAPALGAFAERLDSNGHCGGRLLSIDPSDDEVLRAIDDVRMQSQPQAQSQSQAQAAAAAAATTTVTSLRVPSPPTVEESAAQHLALYRDAGFITPAKTRSISSACAARLLTGSRPRRH